MRANLVLVDNNRGVRGALGRGGGLGCEQGAADKKAAEGSLFELVMLIPAVSNGYRRTSSTYRT
ncbi:hypothetical protein M408DRAFT_141164 [Serendipita vermifera MAFF 305830]|uniref:Uncharacterized protein n=1 Tax=Serendipita vermifera MAFF 305830 TaxID=933852 RepID=A0A0C3B8G1_SERVB|nr:hypothetical protein M408DRAFT_141164 [Serendipita vermifera MAFF 305830]